jgi:hypothetical protein
MLRFFILWGLVGGLIPSIFYVGVLLPSKAVLWKKVGLSILAGPVLWGTILIGLLVGSVMSLSSRKSAGPKTP